ncbi:MAG: tetraacyldisaccharide 4'-kinase [Rhodospirillales bacterium]|nr:tetraacyldisaccharide 4'-kinase [Rhodospirillales bacterium]
MRAPDFWWSPGGGALSTLLEPAAWAYRFAASRRAALVRPWRAGVPVVCVGNLVVGGAGKTPVAIDVADRLAARGIAAHFLSRGYGGRLRGPVRVDADRHGFAEVGDEPLLLARRGPTWVSRDRVAGCRAAVAAGAGAIVMDDGFQNPSVAKDLSFVVVDGGRGFGNGRGLPAGPLREGVAAGLSRADAVVLMGKDEAAVADMIEAVSARAVPILRAHTVPGPELADLAGRSVVAFAGIGNPGKLFSTLRDAGCHMRGEVAFPDHHPYSAVDLAALRDRARATGGLLVTTAKDAQRLPSAPAGDVRVLTIGVEWEDEAALETVLQPIVDAAS